MNLAARPTPDQELLLRAAVLPGPAALEAWHHWRARVDLATLEPASLRLVPQLYRNLLHHDVTDPWLGKLKGFYRYTWSRNQLMLRTAAGVLTALHAAGIDTLVLKGAALAVLHYRDAGARFMDDVDVLVPPRQAAAAMHVLHERGWAAAAPGPPAAHIPYRHALGFGEGTGGQLDLHWNALLECCGPQGDEDFWRGATPLHLAGVTTRALDAADQLLHVCVHGARWSALPAIRWVADAMMILHSAGGALDWDRLVEAAARRRLVVATERALAYLASRFAAPVPERVLGRLRAQPRWRFERLEYRAKARNRAHRLLGDLPVHVFHFLRLTRGVPAGRRLARFSDYLRYRWRLDGTAAVPARVLEKAARRLVSVPAQWIARAASAPRRAAARRLA